MRLGQSAVALKSNARAIARTGLAHLAEQVHQAEWARLSEASEIPLAGWQWDASNDSRTCPACSALDRRIVPERSRLPAIPLHVQCRCQCLPVTQTARELERMDAAERRDGRGRPHTGMELTTQAPPPQGPKEPRAAYVDRLHREGWGVSQVRGPSGERYYSRRVEWRDGDGSTSGFLGELVNRRGRDPVGAAVTLQEYFGGGPAGAKRGAVFSALVRSGTDPHDALMQLMRGSGAASQRSFVPAADLAKRWPEWADALEAVKPQRSVRQQRQLAKGKPMGLPRRGY
jgi:SPP1 gp7 family putative phage head morphogenesis protein